MFVYVTIAVLSILLIMVLISLEKEKRAKCELFIDLDNSKEANKAITLEYNTKITALNQRVQQLNDLYNGAVDRADCACNERNHYKDKCDSLTREVNSLKGKLTAQIKVGEQLFEENAKVVLKISKLEEQLLFSNGTSAVTAEPQSEQVPDPEAEQANQPTTSVRKPRRPRARGNKQAR